MSTNHELRAVILENHPIERTTIRNWLLQGGYSIVGEGGQVEEIFEVLDQFEADFAVVDINLDRDNGLEHLAKLKERCPNIKTIVYSARAQITAIAACYKLGAAACVPKSSPPAILMEAIQSVAKGNVYFMPGIPEQLILCLEP